MLAEAFALAAALHAASQPQPGYLNRYQGLSNVIECPANTSGRVWLSAPSHGCESPGAASYGAIDRGEVVYARIGGLTIGFSPWQEWNNESFPMHEAARQQWLRDHGYTHSVRTFTNDRLWYNPDLRADAQDQTPEWKREIKPRMIIPIPEDMPRTRHRMEVNASKLHEALARAGTAQRVPTVLQAGENLAAK